MAIVPLLMPLEVLRSRRPNRVAECVRPLKLIPVAFLIALLCPVLAVAQDGSAPNQSTLYVSLDGDLLTVDVGDAPLRDVLNKIADLASARVVIRGDLGQVRTQSFAEVPLADGLGRLAGDNGLVLVHGPTSTENGHRAISEIWIYGASNTATAGTARNIGPAERIQEDRRQRLRLVRDLARRIDAASAAGLVEFLANDEDSDVRKIAATALGNIGGEASEDQLTHSLNDPDKTVRIRAARSLMSLQGERAVPTLSRVASSDSAPEVRRVIVQLLGRIRSEEAQQAIRAALSDPDPNVRQAADKIMSRGNSR